jgi:hypothetical protein
MVAGMLDKQYYHTDEKQDKEVLKQKQQLYKFRKKRNYEIEKWVSTPPPQV